MVSIYDVPPRELIEALAAELEKMPEMSPPEWAAYVKTGVSKERPPVESNWWFIRSAAVLRAVYKYGPIGVSKLRTKYSSRKNRGTAPDRTFKASGNILSKILQKLEIVGFVKQVEVKAYKGRAITPKGISFVDKIAVKIKKPYVARPKAEKIVKETEVPKEPTLPAREEKKETKKAEEKKEETPKAEKKKAEKKEIKTAEEKKEEKVKENDQI